MPTDTQYKDELRKEKRDIERKLDLIESGDIETLKKILLDRKEDIQQALED